MTVVEVKCSGKRKANDCTGWCYLTRAGGVDAHITVHRCLRWITTLLCSRNHPLSAKTTHMQHQRHPLPPSQHVSAELSVSTGSALCPIDWTTSTGRRLNN